MLEALRYSDVECGKTPEGYCPVETGYIKQDMLVWCADKKWRPVDCTIMNHSVKDFVGVCTKIKGFMDGFIGLKVKVAAVATGFPNDQWGEIYGTKITGKEGSVFEEMKHVLVVHMCGGGAKHIGLQDIVAIELKEGFSISGKFTGFETHSID